jgi:DNA-binding transcriptional regulator YhcF (GntR family)|tara:strand:- start:478 stop:699 length:222 start_codon:yes stop_codon:yes gene_type:complete
MSILKVEGYDGLVKNTKTGAVVSSSKTEFELYIKNFKRRQTQQDELRSAVKEINNLKSELYEIKQMIKEVINK